MFWSGSTPFSSTQRLLHFCLGAQPVCVCQWDCRASHKHNTPPYLRSTLILIEGGPFVTATGSEVEPLCPAHELFFARVLFSLSCLSPPRHVLFGLADAVPSCDHDQGCFAFHVFLPHWGPRRCIHFYIHVIIFSEERPLIKTPHPNQRWKARGIVVVTLAAPHQCSRSWFYSSCPFFASSRLSLMSLLCSVIVALCMVLLQLLCWLKLNCCSTTGVWSETDTGCGYYTSALKSTVSVKFNGTYTTIAGIGLTDLI